VIFGKHHNAFPANFQSGVIVSNEFMARANAAAEVARKHAPAADATIARHHGA
jgi:hypothetical protein